MNSIGLYKGSIWKESVYKSYVSRKPNDCQINPKNFGPCIHSNKILKKENLTETVHNMIRVFYLSVDKDSVKKHFKPSTSRTSNLC